MQSSRKRATAAADAYPVRASETPTKLSDTPTKAPVDDRERKHKRDNVLGPSQRSQLRQSQDPQMRSAQSTIMRIGALFLAVAVIVVLVGGVLVTDVPRLLFDVATFKRTPITAQDNAAALMAMVLSLPALFALDCVVCARVCPDAGARWFLLHSVGNLVVAAMCVPDFVHTAAWPHAGLSVAYCKTLSFPACSDWPTCMIVAMHVYHILRFKLSSDDLFHHLFFVPIIAGIHFVYVRRRECDSACACIHTHSRSLDV